MKIDVIASESQYLAHMVPIFECLPRDMQGEVHPLREVLRPPNRARVALVASWQDVQPLRQQCRMIYVEHGAGQAYGGDDKHGYLPGYSVSGGVRHQGVIGFISPNQACADRWKTAPAIAVGCGKLDQYVGMKPIASAQPNVCFVWHWPCELAPETRTALPHYQEHLPEIVERFKQQGFGVFGHAHPKWFGKIEQMMWDAGMTVLATDRDVFLNADIVLVDNSSMGPEAMALDRPVVWLNAPWYRRDVHHGGRFWDWTQGVRTIDEPEELESLNLWDVLGDDPAPRAKIVSEVYAFTDGSSSQRAADFIEQILFGQ